MNMQFFRKLPIPKEIKEAFPVPEKLSGIRAESISEMRKILSGESDKLLVIIGPCSADREDAVLEYLLRLRRVQERIAEKVLLIPRLYTNKPRTSGDGYMGMLHQPDPCGEADLLRGLVAIRKLQLRVLSETGFSCADEMLYPENHRYFSDLLAYVTVGARSVEDQQHRLTASGLDIPVGMKNPMSGDLSAMLHSISAAQHSHCFLYRGWEVRSEGNPYAHGILRGYLDRAGNPVPNCRYDDLASLSEEYLSYGLQNPALLVDTNHSNSGKHFEKEPGIALDVLESRKKNPDVGKLVKGLMIESYLLDGRQEIGEGNLSGKSITDACLGWEKTEKLLSEIAERL